MPEDVVNKILETADRAIDAAQEQADSTATTYDSFLLLISVIAGILSGFFGIIGWLALREARRLEGISRTALVESERASSIYRKMEQQLRAEHIWILDIVRGANAVLFGEIKRVEGQPALSDHYFTQAIQLLTGLLQQEDIPEKVRDHAYTNLIGVYKRVGNVQGALRLTKERLDKGATPEIRPLLLYNAACYSALAGVLNEALSYLREAVILKPDLKGMARLDTDFDKLREGPEYKDEFNELLR